MGDGIYDWYSLKQADYGITTIDSLWHVQEKADWVSTRTGGNRFVADACMHILEKFFEVDVSRIGV